MDKPPDHQNVTASTGLNDMAEGDGIAERMFQTAMTVDKYYTPVLFLFGTLGNSLSLAVFCMNSKYRNQSASYYLSALAISDTGFLINLLAVWLESVHGGVITSGIMCPLVMYLGQVTCFMSVYLTVAFSIERYVAVHYPLSRPRICTRSKARKIIAALTAIALLVFSYAWVIAQVIEMPVRKEDYDELYRDISDSSRNRGFNNYSQELSSESDLFPFPDEGKREKRESLILMEEPSRSTTTSPASLHLHASFQQTKNATLHFKNVFEDVQKICAGNASHMVTANESISLPSLNESLNCSHSRSYSNGRILNGFQKIASGKSSEESHTSSLESSSLEANGGGSKEDQFFPSGGYVCTVPPDYYRISEIANYLDSVVTLIIPFFLITFFNVRIAICVWKLKDQRQNIMAPSSSAATENNASRHSNLRCTVGGGASVYRGGKKKKTTTILGSCRRQHSQKCKYRETFAETGEGDKKEFECKDGEGTFYETSFINHRDRSQVGTVRFQDTPPATKFPITTTAVTTAKQKVNNSSSSSEGGSEENSLAENNTGGYGCKSMPPNPTTSAQCPDRGEGSIYSANPGLSETTTRMNTLETLKANTGFHGKSANFGRFSGESGLTTRPNWEQRNNRSPSCRQTMTKPEFSILRERGSTHHPSSNAAEVRVTKTLLLVSTVFLVLNLPAHAIRCAQFIQALRGTTEGQDLLHAAIPWTNILFNTNFSVNFLLYCVSGRNFRKSLRNIILRKFNKKSSSEWKPHKRGRSDYYNPSIASTTAVRVPGSNHNFTKELQLTEIVELGNVSPKNGNVVNLGVTEEDETL